MTTTPSKPDLVALAEHPSEILARILSGQTLRLRQGHHLIERNPATDHVEMTPAFARALLNELASQPSSYEAAREAIPPDWRQDQAETSRIRPSAALPADGGEKDDDERDPYGEAEQWGMQFALRLFGKEIAGVENWEGGDGSESVDGDVLAEFHNIAKAAGWVNADGDTVFGPSEATTSTAGSVREAWVKLSDDTSWLDGRDVVLLAYGMEVTARYCPAEWSDDTPISPREYSGAVWSCFDDAFQFEIEECSKDPREWGHDGATHWRAPQPYPHEAEVCANCGYDTPCDDSCPNANLITGGDHG